MLQTVTGNVESTVDAVELDNVVVGAVGINGDKFGLVKFTLEIFCKWCEHFADDEALLVGAASEERIEEFPCQR